MSSWIVLRWDAAGVQRRHRREPGPAPGGGCRSGGSVIDGDSNAYGPGEVEHYVGERPTMVSDHCLDWSEAAGRPGAITPSRTTRLTLHGGLWG